jgi:hypothetical protein
VTQVLVVDVRSWIAALASMWLFVRYESDRARLPNTRRL